MEGLESLGFKGIRRRIVYDAPSTDWDIDWARYCDRGRGRRVDWSIPVYTGTTLAHLAAEMGILPPGFQLWDLADYQGVTIAHVCARNGTLPSDFPWWDLADHTGWSVAHVAATHGHLPPDFGEWHLADHQGWTVAHEAATHGHLPLGFGEWDLSDCDGRSVAYVAALRNAKLRAASGVPWDVEGPISLVDEVVRKTG